MDPNERNTTEAEKFTGSGAVKLGKSASTNNVKSNTKMHCLSMKEWAGLAQRSLSKNNFAVSTHASSASSAATTDPSPSLKAEEHSTHRPAVTSKAYIKSALQVATFLAYQICTLEKEEEKHDVETNDALFGSIGGSNSFSLPRDYLSWSDYICIYVSGHQSHRLPCVEKIARSGREGTSDENEPFDSQLRDSDEKIPKNLREENLFDIVDAKIDMKEGPSSFSVASRCDVKNRDFRIHSLGIVFYELFSGGMRPPDLPDVAPTDSRANVNVGVSDDARYDPLTAEESKLIDLSGALQILNEEGSSFQNHATEHDVAEDPQYDPLTAEERKVIDLSTALQILDGGDSMPQNHATEHNVADDEYEPLTLEEGKSIVFDSSCVLGMLDLIDGSDCSSPFHDNLVSEVADYPLCNPMNVNESKGVHLHSDKNILNVPDSDNEIQNGIESEAKKKRAFHDSSIKQNNISVEPLQLLGLSPLICDLISHMIGATNVDRSGDEAYQSMANVERDLKWMLANLDRILHNDDTNGFLNTGIPFNNSLYGRESDTSKLLEAYLSSSSGVAMAFISGPSGMGKSRLAQKIASLSAQAGMIFLSGKYDQLQQAKPFSAIASAFNDYFECLTQQRDKIFATNIASKLRKVIRKDGVRVLSKLIPSMANLFDPGTIANARCHECTNAEKRVQYFLTCLVEVLVSSSSSARVTFFLDDLQWTDISSIKFLHHLIPRLKYSREKCQFFFLGCCRDDEIVNKDAFDNFLNEVQHFGVDCTNVQLKGMGMDSVNNMISDLLCLSPHQTRQLSDIVHHKTQGNPLFVIELLKSLYREGMLSISLRLRRWVWDAEKINAMGISSDVATVLTKRLNHSLSKDALCVSSCFGAYMELPVIQSLEKRLGLKLSDSLNIAVTEGLMYKQGGRFYFVHDRIQSAAYHLTKEEERCLHHFQYGLALSYQATEEGNDDMFFTAVDQLNRGGPIAMRDKSQYFVVARLNLNAGKMAMERSDFRTALSFFDHGISYLRRGHWEEHYALSLELFVEACSCALVIADTTKLAILSSQVYTNARSFEDTLTVRYIDLRAVEGLSKLSEAVQKGSSMLAKLGINLSLDRLASWKTNGLLTETRSMLLKYTDQDLLNHKKMNDPTKIMAMKFLQRMIYILFMAAPESQPEACLKMVQLSLTHGLTPLSPTAFVIYGSLLAVLGEIREGYRYSKLAIRLLDTVESREAASEVYQFAARVMAYVEPMQSVTDLILKSRKFGDESGDTSSAMLSLLLYNLFIFWGGKNLESTMSSFEESLNLMGQYKSVAWMTQSLPLYRSALCLRGDDEGVETLMGKTRAWQESEHEIRIAGQNIYLSRIMNLNKMYSLFMLRRYNEMKGFAEKFFIDSTAPFILMAAKYAHVFYGGLVSFWIARVTKENVWFGRGVAALDAMKGWADCSLWNFQNKCFLLEAERSYCLKDKDSANKFYEAAISSSVEHRFQHEEALSCELAGYFSLDVGQSDLALSFFLRSLEKYHSWGAYGKSTSLRQFVQERFGHEVNSNISRLN